MFRRSCQRCLNRSIQHSNSTQKQLIRHLFSKKKSPDQPGEDLFTKLYGVPRSSLIKQSADPSSNQSIEPANAGQDKLNFDRIKQRLADLELFKSEQSSNQSQQQSIQSHFQHLSQQQSSHQSSPQSASSAFDASLDNNPDNPFKQASPQAVQPSNNPPPQSRIGVPEVIEDVDHEAIHGKNDQLIDRMKRLMVQSELDDTEFLNPAVKKAVDQSSNQPNMQSSNQSEQSPVATQTHAASPHTDIASINQTINQTTTPPQLKVQYKPSNRSMVVEEQSVKQGYLTQLQLMRLLAINESVNQPVNESASQSVGHQFDKKDLAKKFHVDERVVGQLLDHVAVPRLFVPDESVNQPDQSGRIGVWPHRSANRSSKHEAPPVYSGGRIMGQHLVEHILKRR